MLAGAATAGTSFRSGSLIHRDVTAAGSQPRFGGYRWWRPWFEGYGEPDIDLFRLALLTTSSGAAGRDTMLRRLLASDTWDELLDVSASHPGDGRAARHRGAK
jgi:hypothetical protein